MRKQKSFAIIDHSKTPFNFILVYNSIHLKILITVWFNPEIVPAHAETPTNPRHVLYQLQGFKLRDVCLPNVHKDVGLTTGSSTPQIFTKNVNSTVNKNWNLRYWFNKLQTL